MGAQAVRLSNGDIDNALKDKDFEVLFQPIFDLGNGALARVETFIRWRHSSLGVLPPGAFISFFETQGRMSELTRYVLGEALAAYQSWRGSHAPGFSINLALSDLSDESFASHFTVLLRERGFPAELVTLECPMPPVETDIATTARQLQRLADTGARLAIEVRGRANDFLKTISPFPFAEIKTGGAAILRFARTVRGPGLSAISELLELAAEQNAAITAVGVEDQASLSALRGLGFSAAQGNHLAKVGSLGQFMPSDVNNVRGLLGLDPLSAEDLAALFRTGAPRLAVAPVEAAQPPADEIEEALVENVIEAAAAAEQSDDDLVQRLAARIARSQPGKPAAGADDEARRAKAKEAAIARAKRNIKLREKLAARNALKERAEARGETPAPHDMQERLSREFGDYAENEAAPEAPEFQPAPQSFSEEPSTPQTAEAAFNAEAPLEVAVEAPAAEPGATPPAPRKLFDARMIVSNARAHFTPTIRVTGPEAVPPEELFGDLHRDEVKPAAFIAEEPALAEDEIPEPMASAAWLEETVAVATDEDAPAPKRAKNFLNRTVIPFSALKITHFWPRAIRNRINRARAERAEAAE